MAVSVGQVLKKFELKNAYVEQFSSSMSQHIYQTDSGMLIQHDELY